MKTIGFILLIGALIGLSVSAQTKKEFKLNSFKKGIDSFQPNFGDSLKLGNPFGENNIQFPPQKKKFPIQNQSLARTDSWQTLSDPYFRMPVFKPEYQSNMPVMKPDTSVHYHLLIQKFRK